MTWPGEELIIKLWETLTEKGIGSMLKPWQIKREGKARNEVRKDELLMLAQVSRDVDAIISGKAVYSPKGGLNLLSSGLGERDHEGRIEPTIDWSEFAPRVADLGVSESVRREVNVAKAVMVAEEVLANDAQKPPEESVDDDWLFSWRESAGRVSSEELQELWGRVLAGEVKQPGSYSVRTLEFLKSLSKSEAELISKVAKFVVAGAIYKNKNEFLDSEGITFSHLLTLQEIGILSGIESTGISALIRSEKPDKFFKHLPARNRVLIMEHEEASKEFTPEIYSITAVGNEILKLASFQVDDAYLESIAKDFAAQGLSVQIADWVQLTANSGEYYNPRKIDA